MTIETGYLLLGCGYLAHGSVGLIQMRVRSQTARRQCVELDHSLALFLGIACLFIATAYRLH